MSDVLCAVCGEPWEVYGLSDSMEAWEVKLFRAGAGCPCCEGVSPKGANIEDAKLAHVKSVVRSGDEDPDRFTLLHDEPTPGWQRPADEVVWTCAGCDTKILRSSDNNKLFWHAPTFQRKWHHNYFRSQIRYDEKGDREPDVEESTYIIGEKSYGPCCVTQCNKCGGHVFRSGESCTGAVLTGDTYDPGASFSNPHDCYEIVCIDCLEATPACSECGEYVCDSGDLDAEGKCCGCSPSDPEPEEEEEEEEGQS